VVWVGKGETCSRKAGKGVKNFDTERGKKRPGRGGGGGKKETNCVSKGEEKGQKINEFPEMLCGGKGPVPVMKSL